MLDLSSPTPRAQCCGSIGECDPKWTPSAWIRSPRSLPASAGADDSHATFILIRKSSTNADKSAQCLTLSDANCPFSAHHSRTSEHPYRRSGADSPGPFQGGVRALPQRLDSKPARVKVPQRHRHGARIGVDRGDRLLRKVQLAHLAGRRDLPPVPIKRRARSLLVGCQCQAI
jgi:hypothetical protein